MVPSLDAGLTLQHPHEIMAVPSLTHSGPHASVSPGREGLSAVPPPGSCRAFHPFAVFVSRELPSETQQVQTQLHRSCSEDFYTYCNVPWKIYIRKEVRGWGQGWDWGQGWRQPALCGVGRSQEDVV